MHIEVTRSRFTLIAALLPAVSVALPRSASAQGTKLGLFAAIGVFLLKFWKIVALAAVVLAGGAFKLFRGRSRQV